VIGLASPENAITDSHDTYPACVREGPAPAAPVQNTSPQKSGFEQVHLARRFGASNLVITPFCMHYVWSGWCNRSQIISGSPTIRPGTTQTSYSSSPLYIPPDNRRPPFGFVGERG
jgi:hypothetical protein